MIGCDVMEFSKKIIVFVGIVFALVVLVCVGIFIYSTINMIEIDWANIISILGVVGTAFTTSIAVYSSKAKMENVYKIKKSFLNEKYSILKDAGMLTQDYAQQEIMSEVQSIDTKLDIEEENALVDNEANFNINL